jgi:hypothetical protein
MSNATITFTGVTLAACQAQVTTAEVIANAGKEVTFIPLDPTATITQVGATTYQLHLVAGQDWTTTTGLARYLYTNDGTSVVFVVKAYGSGTADTPGFTGTVRCVAPKYGGTAGEFATLDVTLPITSGKPTLVTT